MRIIARLTNEFDDWRKTFVRVMKEDIPLANRLKQVMPTSNFQGPTCHKRRVLELRTIQKIINSSKAAEVDRPMHPIQAILGETDLFEKIVGNGLWTVVCHLKPNLIAIISAAQFTLKGSQQVIDFLFIQIHLAVTRDSELIEVFHLHAMKKFTDKFMDDGGEKNKIMLA